MGYSRPQSYQRIAVEYSRPRVRAFKFGSERDPDNISRSYAAWADSFETSDFEVDDCRQMVARRGAWLADRSLWAKWEHVGNCDALELVQLILGL